MWVVTWERQELKRLSVSLSLLCMFWRENRHHMQIGYLHELPQPIECVCTRVRAYVRSCACTLVCVCVHASVGPFAKKTEHLATH